MKIMVNGEPLEIRDEARVSDVVAGLAGGRRNGIAVSLNGEVVPRSSWESVAVSPHDRVEVLSAIGGG